MASSSSSSPSSPPPSPAVASAAAVAATTTTTTTTSSSCFSLVGQRVLVTGAGRGIGRAIAQILYKYGARVAITSRTMSELDETAESLQRMNSSSSSGDEHQADNLSSSCLKIVADVTQADQVERMVQTIVTAWGGIDVLINNAGAAQTIKGPVETLDVSRDLTNLLQINVVSVALVTGTVLRLAMKQKKQQQPSNTTNHSAGHIINISSRAGKVGLPNYSFYVASKFALEGLTASWAAELQEFHIRVNSLSPGMVNTRSFPKPQGLVGVRTAESIEDGLLVLLRNDDEVTGHYLHADELDLARSRGLPDAVALKPINEATFRVAED